MVQRRKGLEQVITAGESKCLLTIMVRVPRELFPFVYQINAKRYVYGSYLNDLETLRDVSLQ